jgi:hypothetical protein
MTSTSKRSTSRIVCVVALVALFVGSLRASAAPRTAKEEYADGVRAYASGRYDEAAAAFERAYALSPRPLIVFNVGQARRKMGDFDRALVAYRTYLATGKDEPAATLAEARGYVAQIEDYLHQSQAPTPTTTPPTPTTPTPPPDSNQAPPPEATPPPPATTTPATPPPTDNTIVAAPPRPKRPLYKSPALWGGVAAGVVVLGLAIGLGVGLGTRSHEPDTTLGTQTATFH